jgi:hypothetical protein
MFWDIREFPVKQNFPLRPWTVLVAGGVANFFFAGGVANFC